MNKIQKSAVNYAMIGGGLMLIIELIRQTWFNEKPQPKLDWGRVAKAGLTGAAVGAVVGGAKEILFPAEKQIGRKATETMLYGLLHDVKLDKTDRRYQRLDKYADDITDRIEEKFGNLLKTVPIRTGSTENGTALKENFDIDIFLSFRKGGFRSTEGMFYALKDFLESLIGSYGITGLRAQRKSIGLEVEVYGNIYKIDIIPCKASYHHPSQTSGYLYVNNDSTWGERSSYTKTDIRLLKSQRLSGAQRDILLVLKQWKSARGIQVSSHLLQNLILQAYAENRYSVPALLNERVIMVLKFIVRSLPDLWISSIENTNNIVTDISDNRKSSIIRACEEMISEYEENHISMIRLLEK